MDIKDEENKLLQKWERHFNSLSQDEKNELVITMTYYHQFCQEFGYEAFHNLAHAELEAAGKEKAEEEAKEFGYPLAG